MHGVHRGILRNAPCERVLAPAGAHDKNFHATLSLLADGAFASFREYRPTDVTLNWQVWDDRVLTEDYGTNAPEYRVSEIARAIRRTLEDAYPYVRVRGELGRVKAYRSGHVYLTLKDEEAVLEAVVWKGMRARLGMEPEEGLEVVASGRLSSYPGRSQYQLIVESMEPAGEGALLKLLEERRKRLAAEGLFDDDRKRRLPFLPDVIGVATSPQGAVIRDILHRLRDRFPCRVLVWPIAVQGERAAEEARLAIEGFNALPPSGPAPRPDVVIVARGGGSVEDLWPFNDESLVRAVAASAIPVISAIGHETDFTLIDFAADVRAPTPTAAAEMATPVKADLEALLSDRAARLIRAQRRLLRDAETQVASVSRALPKPEALLGAWAQRVDRAGERLGFGLSRAASLASQRLARADARLSPHALRSHVRARAAETDALARRLNAALDRRLASERRASEALSVRWAAASPTRRLRAQIDALAQLDGRLFGAARLASRRAQERLAGVAATLRALSHQSVLARGFALVWGPDRTLITRVADARPGTAATLEFADGHRNVQVLGEGGARRDATRKGVQTDLFDE